MSGGLLRGSALIPSSSPYFDQPATVLDVLTIASALVPLQNSARSQVACKVPQKYQRHCFFCSPRSRTARARASRSIDKSLVLSHKLAFRLSKPPDCCCSLFTTPGGDRSLRSALDFPLLALPHQVVDGDWPRTAPKRILFFNKKRCENRHTLHRDCTVFLLVVDETLLLRCHCLL